MIRAEIKLLILRKPFEPFRICLVHGVCHNVVSPDEIAVLTTTVQLFPADQTWMICPLDKIASVESLLTDFQGEAHRSGDS